MEQGASLRLCILKEELEERADKQAGIRVALDVKEAHKRRVYHMGSIGPTLGRVCRTFCHITSYPLRLS